MRKVKFGRRMPKVSKLTKNVRSSDIVERLKMNLPAGQASNAPPLGPSLGSRGIQSGVFVKQFNELTKDFKLATPIRTLITIKGDRSFKIDTLTPPTAHFLKLAAGLKKGSAHPKELTVGQVNLRQIYEIAKVKQTDAHQQHLSLKQISKCIIGSCSTLGIKVVNEKTNTPPLVREDVS